MSLLATPKCHVGSFGTLPRSLWPTMAHVVNFKINYEPCAISGSKSAIIFHAFTFFCCRYCCIIHPDLPQLNVSKSVIISFLMAALSVLFSVPLFVGTKLTEIPYLELAAEEIYLCRDSRPGILR